MPSPEIAVVEYAMSNLVVTHKGFIQLLGVIRIMLNMKNAATLQLILLALNSMKQEKLFATMLIQAVYVYSLCPKKLEFLG
jgi:hypothetical protein